MYVHALARAAACSSLAVHLSTSVYAPLRENASSLQHCASLNLGWVQAQWALSAHVPGPFGYRQVLIGCGFCPLSKLWCFSVPLNRGRPS